MTRKREARSAEFKAQVALEVVRGGHDTATADHHGESRAFIVCRQHSSERNTAYYQTDSGKGKKKTSTADVAAVTE
jgi:hypothetical protein